MRRSIVLLLVVLLLIPCMVIPVYAASDDIETSGGFLGAVGGFFKTLGGLIKDWILKGVEYILEGLKALFIPRDDYFARLLERLKKAANDKFGGILSIGTYLKGRFNSLRAYNGELLVLSFPDSHFFGGQQINLLSGSGGIASMVRGALSGFVVLSTAIFSYKRVLEMINT